ncbi:MAG: alanyl-tRNA editing protein [Chloroflexi bacterium]|nr:alanyl-tRNA editing protein [Chloroflexota bacterium]
MTELLYQTDSYLREFDATVIAVDAAGGRVALDRTAFYPGGGGQPADLGVLMFPGSQTGSQTFEVSETSKVFAAVTQVKKEGTLVWHYLTPQSSSPPAQGGSPHLLAGEGLGVRSGLAVRCSLDWPRRYALMRTHTALHILCGVVWRDYGAQVTGGNMDPGAGRMDFEFATLRGELVGEIEARCNAEVAAARDVRVKILPRAEAFQIPDLIRTKINLLPEGIQEVRTVEIVGLDLQADGGTHVANTREVGRIRVTDYKSKGAINKRIYIEVVDG